MKSFFYILLTCLVISSCSEYQKALNGDDIGTKFKMGEQLHAEGKYGKANRLFAQIIPNYAGKPQAQKLRYLYADTFLKTGQHYLAGYQFDRFAKEYPTSERHEEAMFLAAKSLYMLSPVYSKDQHETKDAIEKLQTFINLYPESKYLAEANALVKELDFKLEKKAFEIAKQFNHVSDYKASLKAFDNFIFNFPGSSLREEVSFLKLDSAYKLAINSVEYKKKERLETAKSYYSSFNTKYADSEFAERANKMKEDIDKQLKEYSSKTNL